MEKIAKKIKKKTGINVLEKTRLSENVRARREFIKRAAKKYNGSEIARFLNQTPESVYQIIRKWKI